MSRVVAVLLALALLAPAVARAQEGDEQEKEEARLLKRARRHAEDDEKAEAWQAFTQLADLARQRGHKKMAITALDEARAVAPSEEEEGRVCATAGLIELQEGDSAGAVKHYKRAVKLLPKDVRAWNNLGYALHREGREKDSLAAYEQCAEIDPGYNLAKVSVGEAARLVGDAKKALKVHKRLLEKAKQEDLAAAGSGNWFYVFESAKMKAQEPKSVSFETAGQRRALVALQVAIDHAFLDDLAEAEAAVAEARKELGPADLAPAIEEALDDLYVALEAREGHFQLRYLVALLLEAKDDGAGAKAELQKFLDAEKAARALAKKAKEKLEGAK